MEELFTRRSLREHLRQREPGRAIVWLIPEVIAQQLNLSVTRFWRSFMSHGFMLTDTCILQKRPLLSGLEGLGTLFLKGFVPVLAALEHFLSCHFGDQVKCIFALHRFPASAE